MEIKNRQQDKLSIFYWIITKSHIHVIKMIRHELPIITKCLLNQFFLLKALTLREYERKMTRYVS